MTTEAEAIAALAREADQKPTIVEMPSKREFLVYPKDYEAREVTPPHSVEVHKPKLIQQTVTLQNAEALIAYVDRFKSDNSLLFANIEDNEIVAALDYHAKDKPELVCHRAVLGLEFSEEWKTWNAINVLQQSQLDFARFIEENAPDIKAPDAGTLLEAVRDLQARRNVSFVAAVRTASDNESFEYHDNTEARTKGDLELPTKFLLSLPVYFGDPPLELQAFLRWRMTEGKLSLGIKLHRAEHVRQAAFQQIVVAVHEHTGVLPVYGAIA